MERNILCISTNDNSSASLRYILRRALPLTKSGKVTAKISDIEGRKSLKIALNDNKEIKASELNKLFQVVTDSIADVVITDFKSSYIEDSIRFIAKDQISRHAFIRALSNFDRDSDKALAKSLIKLTPNFLLDSFCNFKLDDLKTRWNEVCNLANENASHLMCAGTFRELLRFLISNLESRSDEVHLFERGNRLELLTCDLKPFNDVYVADDLPKDVQVVSQLISIAPKKIILHKCCGNESSGGQSDVGRVTDFVQSMFDNCVQVVEQL